MPSLLIRNLRTVVTCDDGDRVLEGVDLLARDGVIQAIGPDLSADAAANRWRDLSRLRRAGRKGSTQDYELLALFSGWITRVRETRGQYEQSLLPPPLKSHRI